MAAASPWKVVQGSDTYKIARAIHRVVDTFRDREHYKRHSVKSLRYLIDKSNTPGGTRPLLKLYHHKKNPYAAFFFFRKKKMGNTANGSYFFTFGFKNTSEDLDDATVFAAIDPDAIVDDLEIVCAEMQVENNNAKLEILSTSIYPAYPPASGAKSYPFNPTDAINSDAKAVWDEAWSRGHLALDSEPPLQIDWPQSGGDDPEETYRWFITV